MSGTRSPQKPKIVLILVYGIMVGLIATGIGGLISQIAYGSSDPTMHILPMLVIAALAVIAGLCAGRVTAWFMAPSQTKRDAATPPQRQVLVRPSPQFGHREDDRGSRRRPSRNYRTEVVVERSKPYSPACRSNGGDG